MIKTNTFTTPPSIYTTKMPLPLQEAMKVPMISSEFVIMVDLLAAFYYDLYRFMYISLMYRLKVVLM